MKHPILIAIGGGGATHGTHPEIDDLCMQYLPVQPRIGFAGAASNDDPQKTGRFASVFRSRAGSITDLPPDCSAMEAADWAADLDLIYIGGGNPIHLCEKWGPQGIDVALFEAARRGVVIAGVSAGAMCWFDRFLWRSPHGELQLARGFGLVPGVVTPHSLIEPDRIVQLETLVARGDLTDALAIDDGAALVLEGGNPLTVFPGEGPPGVHRVFRDQGGEARRAPLAI